MTQKHNNYTNNCDNMSNNESYNIDKESTNMWRNYLEKKLCEYFFFQMNNDHYRKPKIY